ncbi:MAG: aminopeptidase P family protein [Clostridiales bacterium]|nr:aminopeptidase P family protein [Clostridiales bacterium]
MTVGARVVALRERLVQVPLDAMFVTTVANVRYATGFADVFDDEAAVAALVTHDEAVLFTDSRYVEAVRSAADGTPWEVVLATGPLFEPALERIAASGTKALALESGLPYRRYRMIAERFEGRLEVLDDVIEQLREVKDAEETARIEAACALGDRAFDYVLGVLAPGLREIDVALELEVFMRRNGSEGLAFPSIVASGPHSSMPHAGVTHRVLEQGDVLTMDFGARIGGYCSDMTRTVVLGTATEEVRRVHAAVLEAQRTGVAGVAAGKTGIEIDAAARDALARVGLAEHFGHGLGHGVGLAVHELPSVSQRGERVVKAGSVITIEPGVYLQGRFGVRIEDCIVVEDGGCRVLTRSPAELIELN